MSVKVLPVKSSMANDKSAAAAVKTPHDAPTSMAKATSRLTAPA